MIVSSNIALTQTMTSASCITWQWLFGLGGILSILSPLLKAYRVSRVFHGGKMLRAVKITDAMLILYTKAALIAFQMTSFLANFTASLISLESRDYPVRFWHPSGPPPLGCFY